MSKRIATTVVVLALVACGAALAATRGGAKVTLHKESGVGKVLATSKGMTLYLYTPDPKNKGTCTDSCATYWPPLKTSGKPVAGKGVNKKLLGQTSKHQVTYNGHPLYTYSGDAAAGQATGEGSGGTWYAVTAAGKKK